MQMKPILHALGLHLYQPHGNLHKLLAENPGELRRILLCYERIGRYAHKYAGVARFHLAFSTVLLEQLQDPTLIEACRELVDIPSILENLRSAASMEFVGTGFRHAPLPFIPPEDWEEQLQRERKYIATAFGHVMKGYWPPASVFSEEMIPVLVKAGYEYLLLPSNMLTMPDGSDADPFLPYQLSFKGSSITVIPLDRGFSQAQENGLEAPWFADEVRNGVSLALPYSAPYLLTTWSDGENGEWFRTDEEHGFFGRFFSPYMEFCEIGAFPVQPMSIPEYLRNYPPQTKVTLRAEFKENLVFPGDPAVKRKLFKTVAHYWSMAETTPGQVVPPSHAMMEARSLLLRAEESGLLLGDASCHAILLDLLKQAEKHLATKTSDIPVSESIMPRQEGTKKPPQLQERETLQTPSIQASSPIPTKAKIDEKIPLTSHQSKEKKAIQSSDKTNTQPETRLPEPVVSKTAGVSSLKLVSPPKDEIR